MNALNSTCSNVTSVLIFQAVKSSTTVVSSGVTGKRRPLSAHVSQPMPRSKPPPAFNTSKAKRQLDVIEKDLKLTTKALQDRLGISKQGFVWMEVSRHNESSYTLWILNTRRFLKHCLEDYKAPDKIFNWKELSLRQPIGNICWMESYESCRETVIGDHAGCFHAWHDAKNIATRYFQFTRTIAMVHCTMAMLKMWFRLAVLLCAE